MSVVLDAGGVSAFAGQRERLIALRSRISEPPLVPAVVLAEVLTGDHRRDHATNRLLRVCEITVVDEILAREAARLRTLTGRAATISATDAIVAASAADRSDPTIVTSDPKDLTALAAQTRRPMKVHAT